MPDISIIIPTYNRAHLLHYSVESVLNQSRDGWEVIIVDDGSTDDTETSVRNYLEDSRVRFSRQDHKGASAARNRGADLARGNFLIFLDSDDLIKKDLVECLYENKFYEYDVIFWQVKRTTNGKDSIWKAEKLPKMYKFIQATFLAGSVCFRKEIFFQAGGYDHLIKFGENYELGLRIANIDNLKTTYIGKPLMHYTIDTSNRTSNSLSNRLSSHLHQFFKHEEKYLNDNESRAEITYMIGYILEKTGHKMDAKQWYERSWSSSHWSLKPLLRLLYLNLFR